jgi:hypothetical protein
MIKQIPILWWKTKNEDNCEESILFHEVHDDNYKTLDRKKLLIIK